MGDLAESLAGRGVAAVLAERAPSVQGWPLWIEVRCGGSVPLQPLSEARRQLEELGSAGWWDSTRRLRGGLRRRLLGETGADAADVLVAGLRDAAVVAGARPLVVLTRAESADPATALVLRRAVTEPGWFPTALLLVFHRWPADPALAEVASRLGLEPPEPRPEVPPEPIQVAGRPRPEPPPEVRLTLRAAALEGRLPLGSPPSLPPSEDPGSAPRSASFTAGALASRLRVDVLTILERLQLAVECGVALTDDGAGGFSWSEAERDRWSAGLLPSLVAAWSARPDPSSPEPLPAPEPLPVPPAEVERTAAGPGPEPAVVPEGGASVPARRAHPHFHRHAHPREETGGGTEPDGPTPEQLLAAARQALDHGDHRAARQLAARAWAALPDDAEHRTSRVAALLELATSAWHGSGDHATLADARSLAEQAATALVPDDDARLVASVLSVLAGILTDQGEAEGLSRAVDLLTDAIRRLQDSGDPLGAAALLDDQAAAWLRLGDPVRAAHLLRTSRDLFASRVDEAGASAGGLSPAEARRQLAHTDLALARLPLHARPRPGLEQASVDAALTSARSARDAFSALQLPHDLGRALQAEGRLLALADRGDEAVATLSQAARLQQGLGDALGLAGTAAALADLHAARGEPALALRLLADSVELNRRAGSAHGLAQNRAALDGLRELGGPEVERLDARLEAAQRLVGRTRP